MATLQQRFEVERPASSVYEALSHPDRVLHELPGVMGVNRTGEDSFQLIAGPIGGSREFDLKIVSRVPATRIEWAANGGAWTGRIEFEALASERTAVTITADGQGESPPASILHDGLQALKRALQSAEVRVTSGMGGGSGSSSGSSSRSSSGSRDRWASGSRRYANEWRDTARAAFTKPTDFPFAVMRTLSRQVDRMWGDVLHATPVARLPHMVPGLPWHPDVEVCEQDDQVRVCIDVPGVEESNLQVDIDEGWLTVRGERQDARAHEGGNRRSELHYGSFTRRIALPDGVDPDAARAVLRNGVLEVRIPMHRKAPKRVPVQHT